MITLTKLCHHLEEFLQIALFQDFCLNGLQVEGKQQIRKIGTAVSANLATIQKAAQEELDLLLVHHGLFWNRDSHEIRGVKREKLQILLDKEISLLAYHLPLDAHQQLGNNWKAAHDLGWKNLEPFCSYNGLKIGVKGVVGKVSRKEFQSTLEKYYQHPAQAALGGKENIHTAALVSGGAHKNLIDAIAEGVDSFITGTFDEPNWSMAYEEGINFFALGHSATEKIGPRALGNYLAEQFGLEHHFIDIPNPF